MAFTYTSVLTRPNINVPWFKDGNSTDYNTVVNFVKTAPGYVSGTWEQDPTNPNKFNINHTWTDKASWQTMSTSLRATSQFQNRSTYMINNGITIAVTLSA